MGTTAQRRQEMQQAFDAEAERLLAALAAPATDLPGLGPRPSAGELGATLARNANRLAEARAAVYAASLDRDEVRALLDVGTQQVSNLLREHRLVSLDGGDGQVFPGWQFDVDGARMRLDGIRDLVARFPGGVVSLSLWAVAANPTLGGRTPARALADGDLDAVLAAVEVMHAL